MPDVRKIILARLESMGMSFEDLAQRMKSKYSVSPRTVHYFLSGERANGINSKALGHMLDELKLDVTPLKK